jgi:hypothetical protein
MRAAEVVVAGDSKVAVRVIVVTRTAVSAARRVDVDETMEPPNPSAWRSE